MRARACVCAQRSSTNLLLLAPELVDLLDLRLIEPDGGLGHDSLARLVERLLLQLLKLLGLLAVHRPRPRPVLDSLQLIVLQRQSPKVASE